MRSADRTALRMWDPRFLGTYSAIDSHRYKRREDVDREVMRIMQDVPQSRIPFKTSAGIGDNWWDAILNEEVE